MPVPNAIQYPDKHERTEEQIRDDQEQVLDYLARHSVTKLQSMPAIGYWVETRFHSLVATLNNGDKINRSK